MLMKKLFLVAMVFLAAGCARKAPAPVRPAGPPGPRVRTDLPVITVIPAPRQLTENRGQPFRMTAATSIVADTTNGEMRRALSALTSVLRPSTGFALPVVNANNPVAITLPANLDTLRRTAIVLRLLTFIAPDPLGSEGYTLRVDQDTVLIQASSGAGLFHGVQTLRQLLPHRVEDHHFAYARQVAWRVPAVRIEDMPAY